MPLFSRGTVLFDKYCIESHLGQGGFAEVYLATHIHLQVPRALKVVHPHYKGMDTAKLRLIEARFRLEARLGARFGNVPYLVQVYDFEQDPQRKWLALVMEYMPGGSLKERLRRAPSGLPIDEVVAMGHQLAHALAVLHAENIVHRDIKPSNILFDAQGRARLADLGVVQMPDSSTRLVGSRHPGTPAYMSPEQAQGRDFLPPASDIYSLGVVLFEALTGRHPKTLPPDTKPRQWRSDTPDWLEALILQMMAPSPNDRPWNGEVLVQCFQRQRPLRRPFLENASAPPPPSGTGGPASKMPHEPPSRTDIPASAWKAKEATREGRTTTPSAPSPPPPLPPTVSTPSRLALRERILTPAPVSTLAPLKEGCLVALANFRLALYYRGRWMHQWTQKVGTIILLQWLSFTPSLLFLGTREGKWALWQAQGDPSALHPLHEGMLDGAVVAFVNPPHGPWQGLVLTQTGTLWAWDDWSRAPRHWTTLTRARPVGADWTPWGLVIAEVQGRVSLWRPEGPQWKLVGKWRFPTAWRNVKAWYTQVALGSEHGEIWVVNLPQVRVLARWKAHQQGIQHFVPVPSSRLITAGWDPEVRVWDTTGRLLAAASLPALPTALAVYEKNLWIASGHDQLWVWSIP